MWNFPDPILLLVGLGAALVNGALGYGFSTLFTPFALLFVSPKVLNPALVLAELFMNGYLLFHERHFISATWRRTLPMIGGLAPGVVLGSLTLFLLSATSVKIAVYALLLPLVVIQFVGISRPLKREVHAGSAVGVGIGFLYALTTISGPPLALFWRNQGMAKDEFRCSIAQIRAGEGVFTAASYLLLGLFTPAAVGFVLTPLLPLLIGIPVGALLLRNFSRESFGRMAMGFDITVITYGLMVVLAKVNWVGVQTGYLILLIAILAVVTAGVHLTPRKGAPSPDLPQGRG